MNNLSELFGKPIEEITDNELQQLASADIINYGYIMVHYPGHPRANSRGRVLQHIVIAEEVLGKPLPLRTVVHHVDGNGSNNRKANLVICENSSYHELIHQRIRALSECRHANWLKCRHCGEYDDPKNLYVYDRKDRSGRIIHHRDCKSKYDRIRRNPYYRILNSIYNNSDENLL